MSSKLKAAVLGVGYLGTFHAQKLKAHSEVELLGVYDFNQSQATKVATELGVQPFTTAPEALKNVDYVHIPASTQAHYDLVKLSLLAGKHVLVEKPIAATVQQADELVELALKKNLKLAVGHIERFNPSYVEVKKMGLKYKNLQLTRRGPFKTRGSDVSVLHDLMIHDLDLLFWLTGSEIESFHISGSQIVSSTADTALLTAQMKNGANIVIDVSRLASTGQRSLRCLTEEMILNVDSGSHLFEKLSCDKKNESQKLESWSLEKKDALQLETDDFVQAILRNREPMTTGQEGTQILKWIEKFEQELSS
jgi:predicted dehydrogenase